MNIDVIRRNCVEIITEDELKKVMKKRPKAYLGIEPSGEIHIGHMVSIEKMIELQNEGFEVTILLADLHAFLNEKGSLEEVHEIAEYNKEIFKASGLKNANFIYGSEIQLEKEYILDVYRLAVITTIKRAKRGMDVIARKTTDPKVARVLYPIMQSIDMAKLNIDVAVGGLDQRKIHMLARENLPKIGYKAPVCIHMPILVGLDGKEKMSSSKGNYISVVDKEEVIEKKLKKAYCTYEDVNNPVLDIYRFFIFPRYGEVVIKREERFGGDLTFSSFEELKKRFINKEIHPLDLKKAAANYLSQIFEPLRELAGKR